MKPPQMPPRAELRGGRSLSPGYAMSAIAEQGMEMQTPSRQDLYTGLIRIPQQPLWIQGPEHTYNHETPAPDREEPQRRGSGSGRRTDLREGGKRPVLGRFSKADKRKFSSSERGQTREEARRRGQVHEESTRLFNGAAESEKSGRKDTGKEKERTILGSPSRNPFRAFSRLRRRGEEGKLGDKGGKTARKEKRVRVRVGTV